MMLLETHDLAIYIQKKMICQDLHLQIQTNEIWAILGINGSGKTTLLQTLAGLHDDFSGEIALAGQCLQNLSRKNLAKHIGLLFQDNATYFSQSVWDYCASGRFPHQAYWQKSSDKFQDEMIIQQSLQTMDLLPLANKKVQQLSGGELRRLAIAALLAQTPAIYLLDEPTNHLDIVYQVKVLQHFQQLAQRQQAVIMVLHDINHAEKYATHVLLLYDNGEILAGEKQQILTQENITRLYQYPIDRIQYASKIIWQV